MANQSEYTVDIDVVILIGSMKIVKNIRQKKYYFNSKVNRNTIKYISEQREICNRFKNVLQVPFASHSSYKLYLITNILFDLFLFILYLYLTYITKYHFVILNIQG